MPYLELNNQIKLWYIQEGEGPDIVWIPGGDNVAADWRYQFGHFKGDSGTLPSIHAVQEKPRLGK